MIIKRVWAMPNKWTFKIKPIAILIERYKTKEEVWIDPFAGKYSPAELTNDLNPEMDTDAHEEATVWLNSLAKQYDGGFFDPPYSLRQIMECYEGFGATGHIDKKWATTKFYTDAKTLLAKKIKPGGFAISCGWNSIGLGKKRGFEIVEILLVSHGRLHNDTIVTVERKIQDNI